MSNPVLIEDKTPIGDYEIKSVAPKEEKLEKPGFKETLKAGFEKDNTLFNAFTFIDNEVRTGFELLENATEGDTEPFNGLEQQYINASKPEWYGSINATSRTKNEFFRRLAKAQIEEESTEIQHTGSTWGNLVSGAINGITSPLMAVPIAQGIKTATFMPGFAGWLTKGLPQLVGGYAAEEASLYFTQETRTQKEVARNIATAAIMGGILGGAGIAARTLKFNTYKKLIETVSDGREVKFNVNSNGELTGFNLYDDTVIGKPVHTIDLVGESLYGFGKNGELHAATPLIWMAGKAFQNPVLKGLMSKSATMKRYTNDFLEHNFDLNKVVKGESTNREALQTAIWARQAANIKFEQQLADSYYQYLGIDPEQGLLKKTAQAAFKDKSDLLNFPDFTKEFYKATVKGGVSDIGNIATTSKKFIDDHLMPIYNELVDIEKLPPNLSPKMAVQHVMRMYDRESIIRNRPERTRFLINKFSETNEKIIRAEGPERNAKFKVSLLEEEIKSVTNKQTLKVLNKELQEAKNILNVESTKLQSDRNAGIYSEDMLIGDASKGELKFRRVLDKEELELAADNTIDTILGLNEEQLNASITGLLRSGSGGTNPLMPRSLMIDDLELIDNGWLLTDIRQNFQAYNLRMSRLIEMEKYLRENGYKGEGPRLDFITKGIKDDYKNLRAELEGKYTLAEEKSTSKESIKVTSKFEKERNKLDKEMRNDIKTASSIYKRLMGETGVSHGAAIKALRSLKQWYVSTDMGALFLLCLQDAVAPAFRQGFVPYFNHGIKPFLLNAAKMSGNNKRFREQAQDMAIGIETLQAFNFSKYDFGQDMTMPMNFMERISGNAAKAMGVLNGTSLWTDGWQHVASTSSLGQTIRSLQAFKNGTLDESSLRRLLNLRIDPKSDIAQAMLQQFEKHGEVINDGYLTNFHLWGTEKDVINPKLINQAKKLLEGATRKEVGSTIFTGSNIASYPIVGEPSGLMGAFMMYMGWGFNATANYTIPLFQKFDGNRWGSALMMMAVSSIVDPLRQIAAGKEVELEPDVIFKKALLNSGVLGTFGHAFNTVNAMGNIFPEARVDRFKYSRGLISFVPERAVDDMAKIGGMFANQEWNKKDWKRVIRNVPLMNLIYTRKIINDYIDSLDLPENRENAEKLKEWR